MKINEQALSTANNLIKEATINESSMARLYKHMTEHDCGIITAFRGKDESGKPYSAKDNKKRNKSLKAKLTAENLALTKVAGTYIEHFNSDMAKEIKEDSFFVVDVADRGNLEKLLRNWGEQFEQDSILIIPKGGEAATLIGTSERKKAWPKMGESVTFSNRGLGKESQFMTKIKGTPFVFESQAGETIAYKRGVSILAAMKWQDMPL